jgi:hypothetical protein
MNKQKQLTSDQIEEFNHSGLLIIKGFYDLDRDINPIRHGIYNVIGQVMKRHAFDDKRNAFDAENFDAGYQDLIKADRAWGGEIYDAVKQLPAFFRLISDEAHDKLFCQLRNDSIPGIAAGGHGIRIDNPHEEKFRAMWHQEYPAQLRSLDGLVFWSPLVPVTTALGPVRFCPGSHREGPLPVHACDPDQSGRTGAYSLALHDEARIIGKYQQISPLTSPTDLVVIDFLLLHASGHNVGDRSRWTMQFRYFNFADPIGRAHAWKGSFAAGVDFRAIHPELCVRG